LRRREEQHYSIQGQMRGATNQGKKKNPWGRPVRKDHKGENGVKGGKGKTPVQEKGARGTGQKGHGKCGKNRGKRGGKKGMSEGNSANKCQGAVSVDPEEMTSKKFQKKHPRNAGTSREKGGPQKYNLRENDWKAPTRKALCGGISLWGKRGKKGLPLGEALQSRKSPPKKDEKKQKGKKKSLGEIH